MAQWTTTYDGLLALLETYVEDTSDEFANNVQGMVNRAEERIIRDLDLEIFNATATPSTSIGVETISKASAIHVVKSLYYGSNPLLRRSYDFLKMYGGSGTPKYFAEGELTIVLAPVPNAVISLDLRYMSRPQPLSPSVQTNWIAEKCADLLLNGTLIECERFLIAPERVPEFEQAYASSLGPLRAYYRDAAQRDYEPVPPAAAVAQTR